MTDNNPSPERLAWPPATVALDLARQMVAEWRVFSDAVKQAAGDPAALLRLEIAGAGKEQMDAARLAGWFAQVSMAEDLRRLADHFCSHGAPDTPENPFGENWQDSPGAAPF